MKADIHNEMKQHLAAVPYLTFLYFLLCVMKLYISHGRKLCFFFIYLPPIFFYTKTTRNILIYPFG